MPFAFQTSARARPTGALSLLFISSQGLLAQRGEEDTSPSGHEAREARGRPNSPEVRAADGPESDVIATSDLLGQKLHADRHPPHETAHCMRLRGEIIDATVAREARRVGSFVLTGPVDELQKPEAGTQGDADAEGREDDEARAKERRRGRKRGS